MAFGWDKAGHFLRGGLDGAAHHQVSSAGGKGRGGDGWLPAGYAVTRTELREVCRRSGRRWGVAFCPCHEPHRALRGCVLRTWRRSESPRGDGVLWGVIGAVWDDLLVDVAQQQDLVYSDLVQHAKKNYEGEVQDVDAPWEDEHGGNS